MQLIHQFSVLTKKYEVPVIKYRSNEGM